jgi:hypothetical protein
VVGCARARSLAVLDLHPVLANLPPDQIRLLFERHMTPAGNALVAREVIRFLTGLGWLPSLPRPTAY